MGRDGDIDLQSGSNSSPGPPVSPPPCLTNQPPQQHAVALSHSRGRTFVIAAALLWSLSGILIKSPTMQSIPVSQRGMILACYRTLFAAAALLPFVHWRRVHLKPRFAPSMMFFALMNVLFINGFTRTTAGAASFLQYTSTVWVFLFGWLLFKERIQRANFLALISAVCGILWIVLSEQNSQRIDGNLLALGSGAAYAGVVLTLRWLKDEDAAWVTVLNHLASGLVVLPLVLNMNVTLSPLQWTIIAVLGFFQMGLPYLLAARGVALLSVQEAALLMLLEPILIPTWAWLCWGEHVGWPTLIGGTFILGGLAARYVLWPERQRSGEL